MQEKLKKLRGYIPRWLGGTRLSENDQAQSHVMGMALAALKASETNARLMMQQAAVLEEMKKTLDKALLPVTVAANFTHAAGQAKEMMSEWKPGTIEHEAFLLMSSQLYGLADTMKSIYEKQQKKGAGENAGSESVKG